MAPRTLGLVFVALGIMAILVGGLLYLGGLSWFGRLPGDIHVERSGVKVFLPVTSMLVLSLVLTLVLNVLRRFF